MFRVFVFLAASLFAFGADAQMFSVDSFGENSDTQENVSGVAESNEPLGVVKVQKNNDGNVASSISSEGPTLEELTGKNSSGDVSEMLADAFGQDSKEKTDDEDGEETEDVFIPESELHLLNKAPTYDGSERGGQAFVEVDEKGRMKKSEKIFLFYDDFKITNYVSNTATCDVRFNVLSNLDRKISQLDVKLVWPELTTTLSFSNVNPNTQTYYNYSLIGNGCYKMDMAPNIIVNRCRVKGFTSTECANKLIWLSK